MSSPQSSNTSKLAKHPETSLQTKDMQSIISSLQIYLSPSTPIDIERPQAAELSGVSKFVWLAILMSSWYYKTRLHPTSGPKHKGGKEQTYIEPLKNAYQYSSRIIEIYGYLFALQNSLSLPEQSSPQQQQPLLKSRSIKQCGRPSNPWDQEKNPLSTSIILYDLARFVLQPRTKIQRNGSY